MNKQIIHGKDVLTNYRGDYEYKRLDENTIWILLNGVHKSRKVIRGIRRYVIMTGEGEFNIDGKSFEVRCRTRILIEPGQTYSYSGTLEMYEFMIPTDGGIEHVDVE